MGKINNGIPAGFNGRMGNVVGYMWRGQWCVRSLPSQYKDAQSEMQLAQRSLFRHTVAFAGRAKNILRIGLHQSSVDSHLTECNYFMRLNKECFAVVDDALVVDYESLILSEGPVAPVAFDAPQLLDETTISVDFEKNPLHRATKSDDCVYLVAYCPELNSFELSQPSYRSSKQVVMSLKEFYAGREVHLWGFVCDRAGRASMSQYIGSGVLSMEQAEDWEGEDVESDAVMLDDASANIQTEERLEHKTVSKNEPSKRRSDVAPSTPPE